MTNPVPGAAALAAVKNAAAQKAAAQEAAQALQPTGAAAQAPPAVPEFVVTISCPDKPGIVAAVTRMLFEHGGNIEESQQFASHDTSRFFMRLQVSAVAGGGSTGIGSGL